MSFHFQFKTFDQLELKEMYRLLQLRQEVFIVEQDCPYLDADGVDLVSYHVIGRNENNEIIAHTRLVPVGTSYSKYASIGRVVTSINARNQGAGRQLMEYSIKTCHQLFPQKPIKISAQTYLLTFYESLGFEAIGEGYLEDGIPHKAMILENKIL